MEILEYLLWAQKQANPRDGEPPLKQPSRQLLAVSALAESGSLGGQIVTLFHLNDWGDVIVEI
jgi:hypothetical protein